MRNSFRLKRNTQQNKRHDLGFSSTVSTLSEKIGKTESSLKVR